MIYSLLIAICMVIQNSLTHCTTQLTPHILWGVSERQGRRPSMEDTYMAAHNDDTNYTLKTCAFGIFDGHGGSGAAHLAAQYFTTYFSNPQKFRPSATSDIKKVFVQTNAQILRSTSSGTTAVISYITHPNDGANELTIAWVGDSRAVLGDQRNKLIYETRDHKPNYQQEYALINARTDSRGKQCFVSLTNPPRVNGILAISRALGDRDIASCITAEPEVINIVLERKHHKFLILACDGIWDVLSSQDALNIIADAIEGYTSPSQSIVERSIATEKTTEQGYTIMVYAARTLVDAAYKKGSTDNLSALVILFDWDNRYKAYETGMITPKNFINRMSQTWRKFWQSMRKSFGI